MIESGEIYKLIVENVNDLVVVINQDIIFEYMNENVHEELTGYSSEDLIGKEVLNFVHTEDHKKILHEFDNSFETGINFTELRFKHKDGHYVWIETNGKQFKDKDGKIKALLISRDISERKKADERLKDSEEKYRLISENANEIITVQNNKFQIEYVNEVALRNIFGYSAKDVIGKPTIIFTHPDDRKGTVRFFNKLLKKGKFPYQSRYKHKDGHYLWLEITLESYLNSQGEQKYLTISRDITKQKEFEFLLKKSELSYINLLESLDVGFYQTTLDGQMINHNRAHNIILGYEPAEDLKSKDIRQFWETPEDRDTYIEFLLEDGYTKNYLCHAVKKDGKRIIVELNSRLIRDEKGNPIRIDGTFNDVTEKFRLEEKLKESEEKYHGIFDSFPYFIGLMDIKGTLLDCNPAANNFLSRHRREDLIGLNLIQILSIVEENKRLVPHFKRLLEETISDGKFKIFEFKLHRSRGGFLWIRMEGSRVQIGTKKFIQFILQDITERKNTEEKLKKSEFFLKERVKELSSIYKLSKLIENPNINIEGKFQSTLAIIPHAFQYPDIVCARIIYKNKSYSTINFKETEWKLATKGIINQNDMEIDIYYLEENPFLKGEYDLIGDFFLRLKSSIEEIEAKKKLKDSEEKYRDLVNRIPDLLIEVDLKGRFTYASPQLYDLFGFTLSEIRNKRLYKVIHPDDMGKVVDAMKQGFETGKSITVEYRTLHKDGHYVDVSAKGSLLENGRFYGVVRDISERKRIEQKLKESEEKYRLISENANDLIRVLDDKFEFEYINENVHKRLLGYSKEDLLGQTHIPFIHPEDMRHAVRSTVRNLKKGEGSYQARFKDKYGNYKWFEFEGKYFFDSKGVKKILSIARDINERKLAEEKLRESEERYRLISETAYDLIGVLNKKFKYEYININAFKQILGYSDEDIIGKSALKFIHPDDLSRVAKTLFEGFKQGGGGTELRFKHIEGQWLWIEAQGKTYIDKDGETKAIIISRDITERKLAEEKMRKSEKKYRKAYNRANFYKDIFAHDINNILHIINSSSELISYHLGDSEKSKVINDISNIIKKQVDRGAKLVSNITILSDLDEEEIHTEPTEICKLMKNSIEYINKAYDERDINISFACNEDHLFVNANKLLQDVFDNILINSVRYNENSNIEISIEASKTHVNGKNFIKMEFDDNGIGVPDDRKEIVFKRGNRELKGSRGMGIGLSLVKKIIKEYNGKIWIEDKVKGNFSKGSRFILLIPEIV